MKHSPHRLEILGGGDAAFMVWLAMASLALAAAVAVAWPVRPVVEGLAAGALLAAVWAMTLGLARGRAGR